MNVRSETGLKQVGNGSKGLWAGGKTMEHLTAYKQSCLFLYLTSVKTSDGCHSKSFDTVTISIPRFRYFDTGCFKTSLDNNKNALQLEHITFISHFTGDLNQYFLIKFVITSQMLHFALFSPHLNEA